MENLQIQNASSISTTPTSTNSPTLKTNPESNTAGSTTDIKGKQPQVLTLRKKNADDKKKLQIWDHFAKHDVDPKTPRAECNYCEKNYACHTIVNGTSNTWSHLKVCKKFPFVVDRKQKVLVLEPKIGNGELRDQNVRTLKAIGYNYDECRQALAKMVIIDELPFNFMEGQGFKLFARTMQPRFDIPCRFTMMRDCLKLYVEENDRLRTAFRGQRLCLTTDTWTSIENINYMCLRAHWIDNKWNFHKRILNFSQVSNYMGETIGQVIENCMLE